MTTLREAAQQALEALEWHYRQGHSNTLGGWRLKIDEKALRGLKAVLAEPVQEPVKFWPLAPLTGYYDVGGKRVWLEKDEPFPAPPQRKPLAEWQINDLIADIDPEDVCSWSFRQGVYAAEKHQGVRP